MNRIFVPCASGHTPFAECLVERTGDLLRLSGHAEMTFVPDDAKRLLLAVAAFLDATGTPLPAELLERLASDSSGLPVASGTPSNGPHPAAVVLARVVDLFAVSGRWSVVESDPFPLAIASMGRDGCLRLAVALETLRQEMTTRAQSDGR